MVYDILKNRDLLNESRIEQIIGQLWLIIGFLAILTEHKMAGYSFIFMGACDFITSIRIAFFFRKKVKHEQGKSDD